MQIKPSRVLLIAILATGVLYVSSFVALGDSFPTINSSGTQIREWFQDNGTGARIYAWTSPFISLGLAVFGGQVSALLPRPHRYVFLVGVFGFAITAQVQAWFWAGLAFRPQDLDPSTAQAIFDVAAYWGPMINGSTATMAAAVAALGLARPPTIPPWLMWISIVFFVEQAVETVTVFGRTGFIAPGGVMNVYLGGLIGFLWIAAVVYWATHRMDHTDDRHANNQSEP